MPAVSVIVPCHNLGRYLDEAVESVLRQRFQDFEIVIVDDGSTDSETAALLSDYQRPRTRVIRTPHNGLAASRNCGIANTSGRYLCALDADDRLEPEYLARTVQILEEDASVAFVSAWLRTFGDEQWEWKPTRCDLPTLLYEDTVLTAAVVRREAVASVGGFDTRMPVQGDEDWDLWLTLVERGYRGVILPEVLFNYRRRPGSMSTVCWQGPGHLPLAEYRVSKHGDSYRAYLVDVLLHQDADTAELLRRNDESERYLAELESALASRREELTLLKSRLGAAADRHADARRAIELEQALRSVSAEVDALRASLSWRITRPLRDIYGWWLKRRGHR
ncbi:MAG TPA: glycosyltransferase family A protein [Vicinamibacterales bacterium]|jgi:glycosyltransferase involved in cell wall biosynthesis|nr:glycosyltransferase family A protein [Vicinamibacterales bacterium]